MPTINIDGRGQTPKEAIDDMWTRVRPLVARGYVPITQIELVDTKTKSVIERFPVVDPQSSPHDQADQPKATAKPKPTEHRPPTAHEYPYLARVTLEG